MKSIFINPINDLVLFIGLLLIYIIHLIDINSRTEARLPPLDEIREEVASEWRRAKQQQANETFYQSLAQRYQIVVDDAVLQDAKVSAKP